MSTPAAIAPEPPAVIPPSAENIPKPLPQDPVIAHGEAPESADPVIALQRVPDPAVTATPVPQAPAAEYKPASAMDLLESAVGNLNLLANEKLQRRQAFEQDHESGQVAMPLSIDDAVLKSHCELDGSLLEAAEGVFSYIDALHGEMTRMNADAHGKSEKSGISASMLNQRTLVKSMSQEAVAKGLVEHDYSGTEVTVSDVVPDEADPFAGADPKVLTRADIPYADVPPSDTIPVSNGADESAAAEGALLRPGEISGLLDASAGDADSGEENDSAGPREPAPVNPAPDEDLQFSPMPGEAPVPFVEGRREDESPEEMLLRVQQAALAQLEAENAPALPQTPVSEGSAMTEQAQEPAIAVNVQAADHAAEAAPADAETVSADTITVCELEDPFEDPAATSATSIVCGTPIEEVRAQCALQAHELEPAEPVQDVVGEVLRRALAAEPPAAAAPVATVPNAQAGASMPPAASGSGGIPMPEDEGYDGAEDEDEDPSELIPEPVEASTVASEPYYAETPDDGGRGTVSMPVQDGDPESVPIAERQEVERVQKADMARAVRALEADDFMAEVSRTDPWFMDFKAAGYTDGPAYAALCASSRRVDPADSAHWIVVMSRSFEIFVLDPNFQRDLTARFSKLKGRTLEIGLQQCDGIPEGSPRDLAARALEARNAQVRDELSRDASLSRILKIAGARFEDTGITVCKRRQ